MSVSNDVGDDSAGPPPPSDLRLGPLHPLFIGVGDDVEFIVLATPESLLCQLILRAWRRSHLFSSMQIDARVTDLCRPK